MRKPWQAHTLASIMASSVLAVIVACESSAPPPNAPPDEVDASTDGASTDVLVEGGSAASDATADAKSDADASALPPLCDTYSDAVLPDAGALKRWQKIAFDAVKAASETCSVASSFSAGSGTGTPGEEALPYQTDCLYNELREVAGCKNSVGNVYVYANTVDRQGAPCVPASAAESRVLVGFRDPKLRALTTKDVETFIAIVRAKAEANGIIAADAVRLEEALLTRKNTAASVTSNLFSNACDGG